MRSRVQLSFAGALALWAGVAYASPPAEGVTLANRARQVAVRMSQGGAYDQATRAVPLPITDAREQAVQAAVEQGTTYRLARGRIAEPVEVVSARWSKHQLAMRDGGSHEAGWAASARR